MNPYAVRSVIQNPEAFYGRKAELAELYTRLTAMQSCSVVGPRRIGKSSLLYCLSRPQRYRRTLADADNYVFVFIDLQELTGLGPDDFFDTAVFQCRQESDHPVLAETALEEFGTMRGFRRLLMRLRGTGLKLVLCCDEFEMLSENEKFGVEFFTYLRGLCSNYDLALVTSSRSSLYELCHQGNVQSSQFWNIFVELPLGLMTEAEALSLIQTPFSQSGRQLSDEEVGFVQEWAGRHPFFIQICCYHLFSTPLDDVASRFLAEARPHYGYAWERCTPEEQRTLTRLARGTAVVLSEMEFGGLQKQAMTEGTALRPRLASRGWERFILEKLESSSAKSTARESWPSRPEQIDLALLRNLLVEYFSESELEELCFDLNVDYEELAGDEKRKKARSLVGRMEREGRLPELIALCVQVRAHVAWPGHVPAAQQPTSQPAHTGQAGYADFNLKVEQLDNISCQITVDSPAGQDSMVCQLPFDLDEIGRVMVDVGTQVTRGTKTPVSGISPAEIGQALFDTVFSGAIGQLFFESWGEVNNRGQGLRIKLHIDPVQSPEVAALPWEFLYNRRRRRYFSLNRRTPIIRYLDVPVPITCPQIRPPLRVLVAIAAPDGWPPLNLIQERSSIQRAWGNHAHVSVDFVLPATPFALHKRMYEWQPHVFHFMGHGQFDESTGEGALLFADESNQPYPLTGEQLGNLLVNTPSVQLAFLNACQTASLSRSKSLDPFSGVAASLVLAGLPAVIAMQFAISDAAALAFAGGFYPRLAAGETVDQAVSFGRESLHLMLAGSQEWGTPVLFMRVPDGRLFEVVDL